MPIPSTDFIANFLTIIFTILGMTLAAFWLGLIIWAFRDMRLRTRDPLATILAAVLVAVLPFFGAVLYLVLRPPETLADRYSRALEEEALLQEIESRPSCPKCRKATEDDWLVCAYCATELRKQCPSCNNLLKLEWKTCPYCAAPQASKRNRIVSPNLNRKPKETVADLNETAEVITAPKLNPRKRNTQTGKVEKTAETEFAE